MTVFLRKRHGAVMPNLESIAGWFSGGAGIGAGLLSGQGVIDARH